MILGVLPPLSLIQNSTSVQDETWQSSDGKYITKYDWAGFIREQEYYGVYGPGFGSWYIHPGKEDFNGDHLKQELLVHRESKTGDAVQLNMLHGTHFQASSSDAFEVGKIWGPWLWYLVSWTASHQLSKIGSATNSKIRMTVLSPTSLSEPKKKTVNSHMTGSMFPPTNPVARSQELSSCQMVDPQAVPPSSLETITLTKRPWIKAATSTTPHTLTRTGSLNLRTYKQVFTPFKPGQMVVKLGMSQPSFSRTMLRSSMTGQHT